MMNTSILSKIFEPNDVKKYSWEDLNCLAQEIRQEILEVTSRFGGHVGASLGAVEIILALAKTFDFPKDKLIFDVGHQSYAYKLISGRQEKFHDGLRQFDGLSGFPKPSESDFDCFGVGHSSTSISAMTGMVIARDLLHENFHVMSLIGDASLMNGLAFEGLNHLGVLQKKALVILNDNGRSIGESVSALQEIFSSLHTKLKEHPHFNQVKNILKQFDHGQEIIQRTKDFLQERNQVQEFFKSLGWQYEGIIDGHNIQELCEVFARVKSIDKPCVVHVKTVKGKGYFPAESHPEKFHGVGPFDLRTGETKPSKKSYTSIFSEELVAAGASNTKIVAMTAGMELGTGLREFAKHFPERFFDVGISEGHAVTTAAGLAYKKMLPVVAIYSTFLQRAFDELIHDVCLQNLHVIFCLDRAGLVGADGATHHGAFDLSYLRLIPNFKIFVPFDATSFRFMLKKILLNKDEKLQEGAIAIRYPRGQAETILQEDDELDLFQPKKIFSCDGEKNSVTILAVGSVMNLALDVAHALAEKNIAVKVFAVLCVKPLNEKFLNSLDGAIVTLEENVLIGGFGSAVKEILSEKKIKSFGLPDEFIEQGTKDQLFEKIGLTKEKITSEILSWL